MDVVARVFLCLSLVFNLFLLVVLMVLVARLSGGGVVAANTQVAEIEPYRAEEGGLVYEYPTEIGPWGPPVEHMKKHKKW